MGKKQELVSKIGCYSFYLAVIIEVLIVIVDKSAFVNPVEGRLFQITFILFFIKVCLTRYEWYEYVIVFLFCILGAVSYFVTGRNEIIRIVMLIAACKDVDMKKCLKLIFLLTLAGCMAIVVLAWAGVLGTMSLTADYGRGSIETRYTLGMGHPNSLQCMAWALTMLGLYVYADKIKWYGYLLVILANIGLFHLTGSRSSLLVTFFGVALFFWAGCKKYKLFTYGSTVVGISTVVVSVLGSIIVAANASRVYFHMTYATGIRNKSSELWVKIDHILTGRILSLTASQGWQGTITTWKLFGVPENKYYFDMGWVRLFYWYGIIPACIFIITLVGIMLVCAYKKDYAAIVLIAVFSLYTVTEAHAVSVYLARNYVLFLIGAYWYKMMPERKENGRNNC